MQEGPESHAILCLESFISTITILEHLWDYYILKELKKSITTLKAYVDFCTFRTEIRVRI